MKDDGKLFPLRIKILTTLLISLIIVGALLFTFGISYFGFIGLFNLLGVHYDDFYALFLFTIFYCLLSLCTDGLFKMAIFCLWQNKSTEFGREFVQNLSA